jgi:Skp family chaperone for outer membrane proteins
MVQPIPESDMQRAAALTQTHRIDSVSDPQPMPELWALLALMPTGILLLFYLPRFVIGCDYLFRKHPAAAVVVPAVRKGTALNASKLADALTPDLRDMELRKPAFKHKHDVEKARALKEKLDADAELADAAIQREQKRAELQRKRAEIERLEQELGQQKEKRRRWP